MGQKVNPVGFRIPLSPTEEWKSRWFTTNSVKYRKYLAEDVKLRTALLKRLEMAGVARVEIERSLKSMRVVIYVTRPGVVIGRGGSGLDDLKKYIYQVLGYKLGDKNAPKIEMPVEEIKIPDLWAYLVAKRIAEQIEKRLPPRRVANKAMERVIQAGGKGVKVLLAGRINGAEISRREPYHIGSIPLQTLRADIDYAQVPALTRSGYVGVKVWIYRGEKA
ncbi:30S ribosomal protein S3 [Candidatus Amesbacteria bacterium RIFCSPHIGHO2_02_FULL_47_9]|uniref:Small ribosomal subunit protein uS3 n=2 Tax=Microgenomates group TaxID=1794810 RepID=A0A0H4TUG4_9BACT|nr:30S ribosomal protein S3, small subunit ribosomal protein S3 [uncultured Microgenomates bacterium Rifle_16ft_4_minimus_5815]OGC93028.1 MAG: 30S ribosomal protein S3 [Candidatus Amesbacteria bacterium RIFCSPHIGHO2_01_FULL_48_32b]OGD05199.1 MAG: 30S ribosomal protein S3 [Candidatus Amesbacteria bacterium RIFCSPHIGHO2_02_FULL_47_9]OGD07487.1 MAG: 30S ribosomal protein S3 [Candidatus Amesbacteria bacterium RIFCSPLOWO2_01_FULL_49_25]